MFTLVVVKYNFTKVHIMSTEHWVERAAINTEHIIVRVVDCRSPVVIADSLIQLDTVIKDSDFMS